MVRQGYTVLGLPYPGIHHKCYTMLGPWGFFSPYILLRAPRAKNYK